MSASSEATIDAIVKTYLLSRGYDKAAAEMDTEGKSVVDINIADVQSSSSKNSSSVPDACHSVIAASEEKRHLLANQVLSTVTEDIILFSINGGKYTVYNEEYNALRSWCLTSLDIVKSELLLILLPSFVHR